MQKIFTLSLLLSINLNTFSQGCTPKKIQGLTLVNQRSPSDTSTVIVSSCWGNRPQASKKDTDTTIRIRCHATRTSTEPLYILNGWPMEQKDISNLDPNSIESINIIKNASAIAIWGHQGVNGVILITTKKAKTRLLEIVDKTSGSPLVGASISFKPMNNKKSVGFFADASGHVATENLNESRYEIEVSMIGYKNRQAVWKPDSSSNHIELEKNRTTRGRNAEVNVPIQARQIPVKIYPNPLLKGQSFTIELTNPIAATITANVLSVNGQQVLSRSFNVTNRLTIPTDTRWPAGTYFIQLCNQNGERIKTEQVILH
jgi:TonB-dependent SusC/RagA subfamily outer membrane receptor